MLRRVAAAADVILVVVQWGGQGINSRAGGHPLLDALSIFCMSAAAVAAEKGAVQPQVPAVLFIISAANAELAVLSLPRVAILFLGGGNMGREGGVESDSATNSAGERLRSEPAGACGLWLQGMLAPGRQRPQAKLNDHQGPATIFKNKGMGYSKHCAQGMLNTRVLPLHS